VVLITQRLKRGQSTAEWVCFQRSSASWTVDLKARSAGNQGLDGD